LKTKISFDHVNAICLLFVRLPTAEVKKWQRKLFEFEVA
jgi:hypothetical protein